MQENKIVKRIPTNLVTKTIITSSAEYEQNKEYTDEDANIYEKYLQAITNVSIGINGDIEKIKALEDNILEQYNKNVELEKNMEQETEKFARQANTAIEDYNSNAEAKTNTFNSNVETKTTEFNNNSNTKTEEFNNNSTEKINAFNSNAEEKIADYNEHVETLTSRIADLEEETEDLFNALDTEKISGNELYIDDAKACRVISSDIDGMYKQETTTGKNLFDYITNFKSQTSGLKNTLSKDGTITVSGLLTTGYSDIVSAYYITDILEDGETYTIVNENPNNFVILQVIAEKQDGTGNIFYTANENKSYKFVVNKSIYIAYRIKAVTNTLSVWGTESREISTRFMLYKGSNNDLFEKYTGGNASPNPDYPQKVEQVDSVKLNIRGKNLCDGINQNYYLNNDVNICGKLTGNSGLAIDVQDKSHVTVSTKITQNRYRIACTNKLLQEEKDTTVAYRGVQKDNTSATITINTTGYNYLIINATDLGSILAEDGSVATEYEPYKKQTVAINLKGNKLCAVSDTIKDKLLIDRNGNVALQKNVNYSTFSAFNSMNVSFTKSTQFILNISNCVKNVAQNSFNALSNCMLKNTTDGGMGYYGTTAGGNVRITVLNSLLNVTQEDTTSTKLNAAKTFLQNLQQTPEIYYPAEVPELIDLGQLTELPKTFGGINNIWAETNLGNTEIEIEYVQNVKKLLEKQAEQQNARLDNIEALLSTTQTSALLLDNMQTDLEKEVK